MNSKVILNYLDMNYIVVIPGFQGISENESFTIGRGGSDASAVALAKALDADRWKFILTWKVFLQQIQKYAIKQKKIEKILMMRF